MFVHPPRRMRVKPFRLGCPPHILGGLTALLVLCLSPALAQIYQASVRTCLAIEAGMPLGWRDCAAPEGDVLGLARFGSSAPGAAAMGKLGLNVANVVASALKLPGKSS